MKENINQKITGYNNNKGLKYIQVHLKKYQLLMNTFIPEEVSWLKKIFITIDFVCCVVKYGAGINDYFQYNFYKRKAIDRKKFIVGRKWKKIIKICNGKVNQSLFDDKSQFNRVYLKYLGREWLDLDECNYEEFEKFLQKHSKVICKIKQGSGGNGIEIFDSDKSKNLEENYTKLKKNHVILEELIEQQKEMAEFNPSSVNTMRLVTIKEGEEVYLMNAVFRTGNGEGCTDNFHHYGLAALIDVKTGIVYTPAVDKENHQYIIHPLSKKQIIGFNIPNWNDIVDTVKDAAKVMPNVRYVGWDIALNTEGKACIIEGNCASDPDITQMPDQIGQWDQYKKIIKKYK